MPSKKTKTANISNNSKDANDNENNILNNLKDHVDAGDVLFVVSTTNGIQSTDALVKRCISKCPGRRKLNQNLHSKIVDASQFVEICADAQCPERKKQIENSVTPTKKVSDMLNNNSAKSRSIMVKRKSDTSNPSRIKSQSVRPADRNWRRKIILRQMKNHRISSAVMDDTVSHFKPMQMIRPAEKLKVLQDIFDNFVNKQKWESISLDSNNLSGIMNRIGFSKYGFKTAHKSPYATNENEKPKRRSRSVIDIVPRHNCVRSENTRVPSYMGWYWTKTFFKEAKAGYRPGAIPKNIRDIMSYFNGPCSTCMPSDLKTCITYSENDEQIENCRLVEQIVARKPTLKVVRKDGLIYVSMNPLKSAEELKQSQNPYLDDCPPIKFQIALNRQNSESNELGLLGYPCSERPAICDDNKEMQDLLKLLSEECENDSEFYRIANTLCAKPSDLDIEFIAPGANLNNKSVYHEIKYQETQYDKNDLGDLLGNAMSPMRVARKKTKV